MYNGTKRYREISLMIKEGYRSKAKDWGNYTVKKVARLKKPIECYSQDKGKALFNPVIVKMEWDTPPSDDKHEFKKDRKYLPTMRRCHGSIGRAMYYTSITIVIGFSILTLSNFIPTVYFGMLTGVVMLIAILAALTLLPKLIILAKPFGKES